MICHFFPQVVRDANDNCITVCNMENFDPLGVHTGEWLSLEHYLIGDACQRSNVHIISKAIPVTSCVVISVLPPLVSLQATPSW